MARAKKNYDGLYTGNLYSTAASAIDEATAAPAADPAAAPETLEETPRAADPAASEDERGADPAEPVRPTKKYKDRKTYTEEEARAILNSMHTAGHKGLKMPRINIAFTPDVRDYILKMSRMQGQSVSEFMNEVMHFYMDSKSGMYDEIMAIIEKYRSKG